MLAMRKGLGATNVEAIAKALLGGQLHPTFETTYYQPPYLPTGQETQAPVWMYMDPAGAGQIASLLGGSVFQSPPPNLPGAPAANWIRLGDGGQILPGNLLQPGTVLSFGDLCAAENYFANSIPGGELGPSCAGTPNALMTGPGTTAAPIPSAPAPPVTPAIVATRNPPPQITTQGRPIPNFTGAATYAADCVFRTSCGFASGDGYAWRESRGGGSNPDTCVGELVYR